MLRSAAVVSGGRPSLSMKLARSNAVAVGFEAPHWLYKSSLALSAAVLAADSSAICVWAKDIGLVLPKGDTPPKSTIGPVVPVPTSVPVPVYLPWPNTVFTAGAVPVVPVYVPSVMTLDLISAGFVVASWLIPVVVVSVLSCLTPVSVFKSTMPLLVTWLPIVPVVSAVPVVAVLAWLPITSPLSPIAWKRALYNNPP